MSFKSEIPFIKEARIKGTAMTFNKLMINADIDVAPGLAFGKNG